MSLSFVINHLKHGESDQCEFKSSFQKQVIESIVAFANAKGGYVLVGVDDNGLLLGIDLAKSN